MSRRPGEAVKRMFELEDERFKIKLDYWNKKVGRKVRHFTYLIRGNITGTSIVSIRTEPMVQVKWDTGAETLEYPSTLRLLRRKKK